MFQENQTILFYGGKTMPNNGSPTTLNENEEVQSPDEIVETEDSGLVKESILLTIKKMLGLQPEADEFDTDIITFINSAFDTLTQLGVGPKEGFAIESNENKWVDFIEDKTRFNMVKSYIFLKVKILFDTHQSTGAILDVYKQELDRLEWRLNVQVDIPGAFD